MAKRKKRTRLRAWGRWSVYACTVLMCVLMVASYGPEPSWSREVVPPQGSSSPRTYTEVLFFNGVIQFERYPDYRQMGFSSPKPGIYTHFELRSHQNPSSLRSLGMPLLSTSGGGSGGRYTQLWMPTLLPTLILLAFSAILIVRSRRTYMQGCCVDCGYSLQGLTSDVCPECGATHGEA